MAGLEEGHVKGRGRGGGGGLRGVVGEEGASFA